VIRANNEVNVFGTFKQPDSSGGRWTTMIGISDTVAGNPINGSGNLTTWHMPLDGAGFGSSAITLVPSAVTVQIMNPNALQTTSGIVYAGVMSTQAKISGRTETWSDYAARFVEFQAPRLMSAGKLALKGVQINSYPLSMSQLAEFTELISGSDNTGGTYGSAVEESTGFAPIMVYNPNGIQLEFLVTVEYRVRFDLANPASSAHRHFPVASDSTWNSMMQKAIAFGHGVRDIADVVAQAGQAINQLRGGRPAPLMLE